MASSLAPLRRRPIHPGQMFGVLIKVVGHWVDGIAVEMHAVTFCKQEIGVVEPAFTSTKG